jgi:DtxR family transcriptional regulator, Mn-dependent transcriptional regulator
VSAARASKPVVELTAPVEDYLKAVYELETAGEPAETDAIAELLSIAPASVSGMIRRLAEQGLVTHERYRGARLTVAGRRAALRTVRRHRVIEAYLTIALGYSWDRVHDEAERLEHAASDELIDRMESAIGEPATDPHGAPIPSRDGTLREPSLVPLSALAIGDTVRVERVGDRSGEQLRYLAELGIVPGAIVRVAAREPFDGALQLRISDRAQTIGAALAAQVLVKPVRMRRDRG